MAAVKGQHVPGTAFHWEHGYDPLDEATAVKNRHKWTGGKGGSSKGTGVHRITNPEGNHQYVAGPAAGKMVERANSRGHSTTAQHVDDHKQVLASAPKQLQTVWQSAHDKGWSVSLGGFNRAQEGEKPDLVHTLEVLSPDGKTGHRLSWVGGKKTTYNSPTTKKVLADINNDSPSKQMDNRIRSAAGREAAPAPTPSRSREQVQLDAARAEEAKHAEARRKQVAAYEAAQVRQKEARDAVAAKVAQGQKDAETARKASEQKAAEQKKRSEHASTLSGEAARAYKAGDYAKAAKLLDQAAVSDPSRAETFKARRAKVAKAQDEAKNKPSGHVPADVARLRERDAAQQQKKNRWQQELADSNAAHKRGDELGTQAAAAYKAGDYDKALNLLDGAAKANPARADLWQNRRTVVAEKKRKVSNEQKLGDKARFNADMRQRRAVSEAKSKASAQAVAAGDLKAAADRKTQSGRATELSAQAREAFHAGDYSKALGLIDQAAAAVPERAALLKNLRQRVEAARSKAKA